MKDFKKQIVFVESYSTVMIYKIARLFKKKGYKTILIRILKPYLLDIKFYKDAYDEVIDLNIEFVKFNIKNIPFLFLSLLKSSRNLFFSFIKVLKLRPYVVFGRAPPNLIAALFRIVFKKYPFIYFPYDLHVHWVNTIEVAKKIRNLSILEIKAERFCFEHSDGIMHKGAPEEIDLKYLNGRILGDNLKLPKYQIAFHPYCSKEFIVPFNKNKLSKKDGELHFVHVASAGKQTKENYIDRFNESKSLIKQKIHVHLYLSSNTFDNKDFAKKDFINEYKDFSNIEYFHIEDPMDPKELIKKLSRYDFGICPYVLKYFYFDLDRMFSIGNKGTTYLEAGIPFFYCKKVRFLDRVMKNYNLELFWPKNPKNFKDLIKKLDYIKLEKTVAKVRKDFLMEKHFPELEKFVDEVVESKKLTRNI